VAALEPGRAAERVLGVLDHHPRTLGRRGHPITALVGTGLAIGAAGVALILWPGAGETAAPGATALVGTTMKPYPLGSSLVPQLSILLGCFGWAVGTAYLRNVETRLGLLTFTGLQMFVGGLMLFVPATLAGDFAAWHWSPAGLGALAYLMVFNSLFAYTAYAWLSKHATPGQTGSYGLVNPAVATPARLAGARRAAEPRPVDRHRRDPRRRADGELAADGAGREGRAGAGGGSAAVSRTPLAA